MSKLFYSFIFLIIPFVSAFLYLFPLTASAQKSAQNQDYIFPINEIYDYFEPQQGRELASGFPQDECDRMEAVARTNYNNTIVKKAAEGHFSNGISTGKDNSIGKEWFVRYKRCWPNLKEANGGSVIYVALHTKAQIEKDKEIGEIVISGGGINFYALFDFQGNITKWGYD